MIIKDLKDFIPNVEKHYPHYGDIFGLDHFKCDKNGYFVISTKVKQFRHLRIVLDNADPNMVYNFNLGDIKNIMRFKLGNPSIGLYVLPERNNIKCGIPTEHIFSYDDINRDFSSVFYKTSKFDTVVKSVTEYDTNIDKINGSFQIMKIPDKNGFKYCNYKTETESIFNFFHLQDIKDISMGMPMTPMVIPIHTGIKDNSNIKILPWNQNNMPNLSALYDYNKAIPNPPALQKIIPGFSR